MSGISIGSYRSIHHRQSAHSFNVSAVPAAGLTLGDAVRQSLAKRPELAAFAFETRQREAGIAAAGLRPAPQVEVLLDHGQGLNLPAYATAGAAGMDVVSAEDVTLAPGARHAVATGLAMAIPPGFEVQVRPRSGLALKHGITVPNTPGTIDSDYRGELKVILINLGSETFEIRRGDRVAQLVLAPVVQAGWVEVDELDDTARGAGGFGSTGGVVALGS